MINMDRPKNNTAKTLRFGKNLDPQNNPGFEYHRDLRREEMVCIIAVDNVNEAERF